jgi:basic membrane lipoprotein Med (substrate-binding protein (PBP1-ABC) superfamily)
MTDLNLVNIKNEMSVQKGMANRPNTKFHLCDDVYVQHPQKGWIKVQVISVRPQEGDYTKYLVAQITTPVLEKNIRSIKEHTDMLEKELKVLMNA